MLQHIFAHGWSKMRRSPTWNQNVVYAIFLGLLAIYFALQFLALGFFAENIVVEFFPDSDPILIVSVYLLYYFIADIIIRLIMQQYPFLDVKPYLVFPIKKSTLVHSLLIKSLRSFFNFFPLFVIIPFAIKTVFPTEGVLTGFTFLIFFWGLIFFNNFLSFLLDKYFKTKPIVSAVITSIILVTLYLDFTGTIGLRTWLEPVMDKVIHFAPAMILPFIGAALFYYLLFKMLKSNLYLEDYIKDQKVSEVNPLSLGIFSQFGEAGKLMDLEAKLIWRNKRSKSILYISVLFILYPLIFIGSPAMDMMWFKLFLGLFVTGAFALNYGQLMLSWNSPHFDLLLVRGFKIEHIFQSKYYLLAISCVILFVFAMLYGIMDRSFLVIVPVMFLFNVGVSIFLYMLLASYNSKRIDPSKGALMNYEGIGAAHFLIMIPLILLPYLLYLPFSLMGYPNMGIAFIGLIGLAGFIFHRSLIKIATNLFQRNKYHIAAAFRKKS